MTERFTSPGSFISADRSRNWSARTLAGSMRSMGTGTFKWRHRYEQPNNGSALVTSSGLVFTGDLDGNFNAFDTKTGKMLWQYNTGSPIAAAPSEYTIGGTEYLAVASGPAGFVKDPAKTDQNAGPMVTVFAAKD